METKRQLDELMAREGRSGVSTSTHGDAETEGKDISELRTALRSAAEQSDLNSLELKRLADSHSQLNIKSKETEAAIAQALKLLQAQVVTKASREELREALGRALDASSASQERTREIADAVEKLSQEAHRPGKGMGGTNSRHMLTVTKLNVDGVHSSTHCMACMQPLPRSVSPPSPHEVAYRPSGSNPASPKRRSPHTSFEAHSFGDQFEGELLGDPARGAPGTIAPSTLLSRPTSASSTVATASLRPTSFHPPAVRQGLDFARNAKLTYGREPSNEIRRRTRRELQELSEGSAAIKAQSPAIIGNRRVGVTRALSASALRPITDASAASFQ